MPSFSVEDFSLKHTLGSGQFFTYDKDGEWYYITTPHTVFKVRQAKNKIHYDNLPENELRIFLGLAVPYPDIIQKLQKDKVLQKYIASCRGLRVMRLDPWQCTVSFVCSSASNIPKIRRSLLLLSQEYGKKKQYDGKHFSLFPEHGSLGKKLKDARVGFRAPFLAALNTIPTSFFTSLTLMPYNEAKQHLCSMQGIGEKIADCILLFAYNKWEAFPVDVWIQRAINQCYFAGKEKAIRDMRQHALKIFPHYPGYAQQFLYHGFRIQAGATK